jgi:hypothetical protein
MVLGKVSKSDYLDMTGTMRQPPDTTYLDMSGGANSTLRPLDTNYPEIPRSPKQEPETKVWIERVRLRRPMSRQEIEENFEFFEALEQERRTDKLGWLVLSLVWLAVFGVLLILIYFGVIPICNL